MNLFDYQEDALTKVEEAFKRTNRVLLVMAVGSGKTNTALTLCKRYHDRGLKCVWLTHRRELVKQTVDRIKHVGGTAKVVMSGETMSTRDATVTVASVDTLVSRLTHIQADMIICDEAHRSVTDTWTKLINRYGNGVRILGLTATPTRADKTGLSDIFNEMVLGPSEESLISLGRLVPCDVIAPKVGQTKNMSEDPVDAWVNRFSGQHGFIFAANVKLANLYASQLRARGVIAASLTSKTKSSDRDARIYAFRGGKINVLTSVNVFTEGFDAPIASCGILARSCSSLSAWRQMTGRILRAYPGKTKATLLDLKGSVYQWGHPTSPIPWSLAGRGYQKAAPTVSQCLKCGNVWYSKLSDKCTLCGAERLVKKRERGTVKKAEMGDFSEEDFRKARDSVKEWLAIAKARGYNIKWVGIQCKNTFGFWPPNNWIRGY